MRDKILVLFLCFFVCLGVVVAVVTIGGKEEIPTGHPPPSSRPPLPASLQAEAAIFSATNLARKKWGKPPLLRSVRLSELARAKSRLMLKENFFSHVTPDGKTLRDWFSDKQMPYRAIAENIGRFEGVFPAIPTNPVVSGWLSSPGHRANLLDEKGIGFTHLGIGVAVGQSPDGVGQICYYTQIFWLP